MDFSLRKLGVQSSKNVQLNNSQPIRGNYTAQKPSFGQASDSFTKQDSFGDKFHAAANTVNSAPKGKQLTPAQIASRLANSIYEQAQK